MSSRDPGNALRIDNAAKCIWRDGERVGVPPKAFLVLRRLMERPGQLVTKDDLRMMPRSRCDARLDVAHSPPPAQPRFLLSYACHIQIIIPPMSQGTNMRGMLTWITSVLLYGLLTAPTLHAQDDICVADVDGNGMVSIDELIRGVNAALNGCTPYCAHISGVWDMTVMATSSCASESFTFEYELTIDENDETCQFDGTIKVLTSPRPDEIGDISRIEGGIRGGYLLSFDRIGFDQHYTGGTTPEGNFMAGDDGACRWRAVRHEQSS
jgi:hypothetical protein